MHLKLTLAHLSFQLVQKVDRFVERSIGMPTMALHLFCGRNIRNGVK